jgi:hypothetical protein
LWALAAAAGLASIGTEAMFRAKFGRKLLKHPK